MATEEHGAGAEVFALVFLALFLLVGSLFTLRWLCAKRQLTYKFHLFVLLLAVGCWAFVSLTQQIALEEDVFDPYMALGLSDNADKRVVRKAYRQLSLQHHPDKVPKAEQKAAAKAFDKIAKAYKALTDPEGMRNFKRFGHPDGSKMYRAGVALPGFMFDKQNQLAMMIFYLALVIILPSWLYFGFKAKKRKGELSFQSKKTIAQSMHSECEMKDFVRLIIQCEEIEQVTQSVADYIKDLRCALLQDGLAEEELSKDDEVLVWAILYRHPDRHTHTCKALSQGEALGEALTTVQETAVEALAFMLEIAREQRFAFCVGSILQLRQCVQQQCTGSEVAGSAQNKFEANNPVAVAKGLAAPASVRVHADAFTVDEDDDGNEQRMPDIQVNDAVTVEVTLQFGEHCSLPPRHSRASSLSQEHTTQTGDLADSDAAECRKYWLLAALQRSGGAMSKTGALCQFTGVKEVKPAHSQRLTFKVLMSEPGEFHLAIQVASAYFSGVGGDVCIPIKVVGRDAGGDESSEEED